MKLKNESIGQANKRFKIEKNDEIDVIYQERAEVYKPWKTRKENC